MAAPSNIDPIMLYAQHNSDFAAKFLNHSKRKLEKDRREGTGPKFIRVSQTCIKYRLIDLIEYQNERLARNTIGLLSEGGES